MIFSLPPIRIFAMYVVDVALLLIGYVALRYLIPKAASRKPAETFVGLVAALFVLAVLFLPAAEVLLAVAGLAATGVAYGLGARKKRQTRRRGSEE